MATIFEQEDQRTPITYNSCKKLGMKYRDTLDPQFVYQVEGWVGLANGVRRSMMDQLRVVFRLITGEVEVSYSLDAGWSNRNWMRLSNPCEEELIVLVEAIRQKFETK